MTVSVVVGGQFGSEGKGKVAHWLAKEQHAKIAIRVGGPNSGHTVEAGGKRYALQQVPTPCLHEDVVGVLPAGSYIDIDVLLAEVKLLNLSPSRLLIHPEAVVIDEATKRLEVDCGLIERIGSTGQGVGYAISNRVMRNSCVTFAKSCFELRDYIRPDLPDVIAEAIATKQRIILEGTQGFGLSLLHSGHYPFTTSRDTTAASVLSEVGISPLAVDCIALVLRAFPIRVAGNSGVLLNETSWDEVTKNSGSSHQLIENTTVTGRIRRIADFDRELAIRAVNHNLPSLVVLNHVDYFDYSVHETERLSNRCLSNVASIEESLNVPIDLVGTGPSTLVKRPAYGWQLVDAA